MQKNINQYLALSKRRKSVYSCLFDLSAMLNELYLRLSETPCRLYKTILQTSLRYHHKLHYLLLFCDLGHTLYCLYLQQSQDRRNLVQTTYEQKDVIANCYTQYTCTWCWLMVCMSLSRKSEVVSKPVRALTMVGERAPRTIETHPLLHLNFTMSESATRIGQSWRALFQLPPVSGAYIVVVAGKQSNVEVSPRCQFVTGFRKTKVNFLSETAKINLYCFFCNIIICFRPILTYR
jgi:hypothetical protein